MNNLIQDLKDFIRFPFINGQYTSSSSIEFMDIVSPIDGQKLIQASCCCENEVNLAVQSARAAFDQGVWASLHASQKKKIMLKFADLIEKNAETFALLDTLCMGKPIQDCLKNDIPLATHYYRWFAEAIDKIYDLCIPPHENERGMITREPLGVVAAIAPWNYPMENVAWKLAPALAAGNSIVLKPSENSTLSALLLGKYIQEAGFPEGTINIIPGLGMKTGRYLTLHKEVDGIAFTGSSKVGRMICMQAAETNIKRISVECGGKSAFLVSKNCSDLSCAAETLARSLFKNQGQTCSAPSRLIIDKKIKDPFSALLLQEVRKYRPNNPLLKETILGAIASQKQMESVLKYIEMGEREGAQLLVGGQRVFPVPNGCYIEPAVFDQVTPDMTIAREEIFGPVLSIISASNIQDAVSKANDSDFGLVAAVWSDQIDEALEASKKLRVGTVHINCYGEDDITAPFGGYKQSGNGSKDKSLLALDNFTELKTTWIKIRKLYDA